MQPRPKPGRSKVIPEVIKDIEDRKRAGIKTYGMELETHNGRDALLDAYEEALDQAIYLKQALMERDAPGIVVVESCGVCGWMGGKHGPMCWLFASVENK